MTDQRKFTTALFFSAALVLLVLASHTFLDPLLTGLREQARRRAHYEKVISKKGLGLHRGLFWKEKQ